MIRVTYRCPHCASTSRSEISDDHRALRCPGCGNVAGASDVPHSEGRIPECLVCGGTDLFVRKNFPQRLGVTIVVTGLAASCVSWYFHQIVLTFGILFATALVDVVLYLLMSDVLECYRCHAQYVGLVDFEQHRPFALETHERYRQLAARTARDDRDQMTTGAS